ncbi:MAG: citrate/2-methylcitrate synthase [Thermoplasmata archaeon]
MPGPEARGLDGVVIGRSSITEIDGERGTLAYRGFSIDELVPGVPYESVVHLLVEGEPPSEDPSPEVCQALRERRALPPAATAVVDALPSDLPPLAAMRTILSALGDGRYGYPPTRSDGYDLMARLPIAFGRFVRRRRGLPPPAIPAHLGQAETYLAWVGDRPADPARRAALEGYFDLLADHGMNASTFGLCVALSTESDYFSAATAALGVLKGPRHGGAPSRVLDMLDRIGTIERVPEEVEARFARREILYGFGHRVYKAEDPRSELLHALARPIAEPGRLALAEAVEREVLDAFRRHRPGARIYTNVEFYAAVLLEAVGIPRDCFTATFAVARTAGWIAHALEQAAANRLMRPEVDYVGPAAGRHWPRPRTPVGGRTEPI